MRGIEGERVLVRIYLGESKRAHGEVLYRQLLELLRQEGLAGASILKGCVGYGHDREVHTATLERVAADLPVVIETVDSPEHVEDLLGNIDALVTGGLVVTERAHVVRYESQGGTVEPVLSPPWPGRLGQTSGVDRRGAWLPDSRIMLLGACGAQRAGA